MSNISGGKKLFISTVEEKETARRRESTLILIHFSVHTRQRNFCTNLSHYSISLIFFGKKPNAAKNVYKKNHNNIQRINEWEKKNRRIKSITRRHTFTCARTIDEENTIFSHMFFSRTKYFIVVAVAFFPSLAKHEYMRNTYPTIHTINYIYEIINT